MTARKGRCNGKLLIVNTMDFKKKECEFATHLAFGITKIVLKAAAVAAAFCMVKEIHKVHKAIERREKK